MYIFQTNQLVLILDAFPIVKIAENTSSKAWISWVFECADVADGGKHPQQLWLSPPSSGDSNEPTSDWLARIRRRPCRAQKATRKVKFMLHQKCFQKHSVFPKLFYGKHLDLSLTQWMKPSQTWIPSVSRTIHWKWTVYTCCVLKHDLTVVR